MRLWMTLLAGIVLATAAHAGIDLDWNGCGDYAGRARDHAFTCTTPSGVSRLFGTFRSPTAIPNFVALEAVIDIRSESGTLPDFWHFEVGGCNRFAIRFILDVDSVVCAPAWPWPQNALGATAFLTAYAPGYGGPGRARMLLAVVRASSDPVPIAANVDYFGFEAEITPDFGPACAGCSDPAEIFWTSARLISNEVGQAPVDLYAPERSANHVTVNGGGGVMRVFDMDPEFARNDSLRVLTVRGYGFSADASSRLVCAGEADIPGVSSAATADGSALSAVFDVRQRRAGRWGLVVQEAGGGVDALQDILTLDEVLRLTAVSPTSAAALGAWVLTVSGAGIKPGATMALALPGGGGGIAGFSTTVSGDGASASANFSLQGRSLGVRSVVVRNPGGETAVLPSAFTIRLGSVVLAGMSPVHGADTSAVRVVFTGSGMSALDSMHMTRAGEPAIPGTGLAVNPGGDSLAVTFDVRGQALGDWIVEALLGGTVAAQFPQRFFVHQPPALNSVSPLRGGNTGSLELTLTGAGMVQGTAAILQRGAARITAGPAAVSAAGTVLTAGFDLADRPVGVYDVILRLPWEEEHQLPGAFEIREGLRIATVTPAVGADTAVVTVTMTGNAFETGASVSLLAAGLSTTEGTGVVVIDSGTRIVAGFDLRGAPHGLRDVRVSNADGVYMVRPQAFLVAAVPHVSGCSPGLGYDSDSLAITISGTNFIATPSVSLVRGTLSIIGAVTITSSTTCVARFDLRQKAPGLWDVSLTNPGGMTSVLPAAVEVRATLSLSTLIPAGGPDSAPLMCTVSGRGIMPGAAVSLTRPGQATRAGQDVVVVADGTGLTTRIDLTGAHAGNWTLTVVNPDLKQRSWTPFVVSGVPAPVASSIVTAGDAGSVTLTISGANFGDAAGLRLEKSGQTPIVAGSVVVAANGSTISGVASLRDRALGLWAIVVAQPGGEATLAQAFEITPEMRVTSVVPSAMAIGQTGVVTAFGRYFTPGSTFRLRRGGNELVVVGTAVAPDGNSIQGTLDLTAAAAGTWEVVITRPDGVTAVLGNGFRVGSLVPWTPLALTWDACNDSDPPGVENVILECDDPDSRARLFGNYRITNPIAGVVALSAVLDLWFGGAPVPPFWHLEGNGCNAGAAAVLDSRDVSVCQGSLATFTGNSGTQTDAFITAYAAGFMSPDRSRLLLAVVRASSNPGTLPAANHFGFELDFFADGATTCSGCLAPVTIAWSTLVLESAMNGGGEAIAHVAEGGAGFPYAVTVNGGAGSGVTATMLSEFSAEASVAGIQVRWQLGMPDLFTAVRVERGEANSGWSVIAPEVAASGDRETVLDRDVAPGATYQYRLYATQRGGMTRTFGPISVTTALAVARAEVLTLTPNPTAGAAALEFSLARAAEVRISVVDVQGRERAVVSSGARSAGRHLVTWDGRFDGATAAAGVYFIRIDTGGRVETRRFAVMP